tara:strand:- start:8935 stop:9225 length:291 start_codon:yes stop_codon:yes gene_type:complete
MMAGHILIENCHIDFIVVFRIVLYVNVLNEMFFTIYVVVSNKTKEASLYPISLTVSPDRFHAKTTGWMFDSAQMFSQWSEILISLSNIIKNLYNVK